MTGVAGCQPGWKVDGGAASTAPGAPDSPFVGPSAAGMAGAEEKYPCVGAHSGPGPVTAAWAAGPARRWTDSAPNTSLCMNAGESLRVAAAARERPCRSRRAVTAAQASDRIHHATMPVPAAAAPTPRRSSMPVCCWRPEASFSCPSRPEPTRQRRSPKSSTASAVRTSPHHPGAAIRATAASFDAV